MAVIALVVMGGPGQDWVGVEEEWRSQIERRGRKDVGGIVGGMWKGGCKATKLGTGIAACTKLGRNFDAFANAHSPPPTPFQPFRAILVISPVPANAKQQPMQKIAVVQLAEAFKLPSKSFVASTALLPSSQ